MEYQYDLMGVIICWALTVVLLFILLFIVVSILYYLISNKTKMEVNESIKTTLEEFKEIL